MLQKKLRSSSKLKLIIFQEQRRDFFELKIFFKTSRLIYSTRNFYKNSISEKSIFKNKQKMTEIVKGIFK